MIMYFKRYIIVDWLQRHLHYVNYYPKYGNVTVMHVGDKYQKCRDYLLSKGFIESISGFGKNYTNQKLGLCVTLYGVII